jgi:hypothetical protein
LEPSFDFGTGGPSVIAQRHQDRRDLLARKVFHREQLYSDFISETAHAFVDAVQHAFHDPSRLIPSYALLSRMRLSSSKNVVESAERVIDIIVKTYAQPNLTGEEIHALAGERNDPLREFSNICRQDLESLWKVF